MSVNDGEILFWRGSARPVPIAETQPRSHLSLVVDIINGHVLYSYSAFIQVYTFLMAIHFFFILNLPREFIAHASRVTSHNILSVGTIL